MNIQLQHNQTQFFHIIELKRTYITLRNRKETRYGHSSETRRVRIIAQLTFAANAP